MRFYQLCFLAAVAAFDSGAATAETQKFGAPVTLTSPTSLKTATSSFDLYKERDLLAGGIVTKVCQQKGCWMAIKTDAIDVRVTFKDYGFFVPFSSTGRSVRMQGRLFKKEMSVGEQKHLLEDEGASKAAIDAVKTPKTEFAFVASGVEFR